MAKTKTYRQAVRREGRQQFLKGLGQQVKAGAQIAPLMATVATLGAGAGAGSTAAAFKAIGNKIISNPLGTAAGIGGLGATGAAIKNKAVGMYNEAVGLAKWIFNHPEWYIRFIIADARLNYSFRSTNVIDTSNSVDPLYPQAVVIEYQLNEPYDSVAADVATQSIQADLLSLRRARGFGYSEYTAKDLANYIRNTRIVVCEVSELARLLKLFNNYDITNTKMPYAIIAAADSVYANMSTVDTEYNSLAAYKHEFVQLLNQLAVNCMGALPLYDRTIWLASNVFCDTKGSKTIAYMPRHAKSNTVESVSNATAGNEYAYYNAAKTVVTGSLPVGGLITNRLNYVRTLIRNCFINDPIANQITSDLLYLYGPQASAIPEYFNYLATTIDEPVPLVHDEYLLSQVQNAHVVGYTYHEYNPVTTKSMGFFDHHVKMANTFAYTLRRNWSSAAYPTASLTSMFEDFLVANTTLDPKNISEGMQISMLRLQAVLPETHRYAYKLDTGNGWGDTIFGIMEPGASSIDVGFDKSETITRIRMVYPDSISSFAEETIIHPGNISLPIVFDEVSINVPLTIENNWALTTTTWGMTDWMPRVIKPALYGFDTTGARFDALVANDPEVFLWDINQYAPYGKKEIDAMDQDAVQSLYVWTWNGQSLIAPNIKTIARTNLTKGGSQSRSK